MNLLRCDPNLKFSDDIHILDSTSTTAESIGSIEATFGERQLQLLNFGVLSNESVTLIKVNGETSRNIRIQETF
jgi:hypothetical protein